MRLFLISTKVPALAPSARTVLGRMYAYGPTLQLEPITHSERLELITRARSPTNASRRKAPGPISQAAPTVVRPSRWVPARRSVSRPTSTPQST